MEVPHTPPSVSTADPDPTLSVAAAPFEPRYGIVGTDPRIRRLLTRIPHYAATDIPVLVTGETGTGKELVARALHDAGPRASGPFVALGCGAVPAGLAESELFGHERGAFTGASATHVGVFERADGGTLLLDDIDDLPLPVQAKLLRVLQSGAIVRVGGQRELVTTARVVATTKRDLGRAVDEGSFRPDLFYRLRGLEIGLPPLRDRQQDISNLVAHFLVGNEQVFGRPFRLADDARDCLLAYRWPGNVRELFHTMEAACVHAIYGVVGARHLPDSVCEQRAGETELSELVSLDLQGRSSVPFSDVVALVEESLIRWAMDRGRGRQTEAARLLGLPRTTLQSKLDRFQIKDHD